MVTWAVDGGEGGGETSLLHISEGIEKLGQVLFHRIKLAAIKARSQVIFHED